MAASDRNLLFGIIALQMDFIKREQLVAATSTWLTDKTRGGKSISGDKPLAGGGGSFSVRSTTGRAA